MGSSANRFGPLNGLLRISVLVLVLSKTMNPDALSGTPVLSVAPSVAGISAAGYLFLSALICVFVAAPWRHLLLPVVDICIGSLVFLAHPDPALMMVFGLAIIEAFQASSTMGTLVGFIVLVLAGGESYVAAKTTFLSSHLPLSAAILFLAGILGYAFACQQQDARQTKALIRVIQASQELGSKATTEDVMKIVCELVKALFRADTVAVYLVDKEKPEETMMLAKGVESSHAEDFKDFNPEMSNSVLYDLAIKEKQGKVFADFNSYDGEERIIPQDKDCRSAMLAPLLFEGEPLGAMFTSFRLPNKYSKEIFDLYTLMSSQVALAVRNVQLQQGMAALAITDSLSGLYTHGYFQEHLGKEVTKTKYANQSVALMIMDMDFFKKVNDNYGHPQGDALLKQLGGVIQSVVRPNDTVCRYGGDEFTITMPETNRISAVVVAERIRQAVEEYEFVIGSHIVHITVSGGVAAFPEDAETKKELIEKADQAMYEAKHKGRNKVCFAA